jgi:VWFA-related protein
MLASMVIVAVLLLCALLLGAQTAPTSPQSRQAEDSGKSTASHTPKQPESSTPPQARASSGQVEEIVGGGFVIRKQVGEVLLYATVLDEHKKPVLGLDGSAFTVYEDGVKQTITLFHHEDIPVSLGIVLDNSGSMQQRRAAVNKAAINLVKASNPQDEVFVVNFNDEAYLDQDYTASIPQLQKALERINASEATALYDATIEAAKHLKQNARLEKKVLLVVTDGDDNASRQSLEETIRHVQADNGPTVYTIGLLWADPGLQQARRALQSLADETGGVAFFPRDLGEVNDISKSVAHDVRSHYTIGYKPSRAKGLGGYRTIRVEVRAGKNRKFQVRTRKGYYASPEQETAR